MKDTAARLEQCFQTVFPNLEPGSIRTASAATVAEWDSVAQVTLLSVIGEEFDLDIDFEEFEGASSFDAMLEKLNQQSG